MCKGWLGRKRTDTESSAETASAHFPVGLAVNSITPPLCQRNKQRTNKLWSTRGEDGRISTIANTHKQDTHAGAQLQDPQAVVRKNV